MAVVHESELARLEEIGKQITAEPWAIERAMSEILGKYEAIINRVNGQFESLSRLDTELHSLIFGGIAEELSDRARAVEAEIMAGYRRMHSAAGTIEATISQFERQGYRVDGLDRLRSNVNELRGILAPDSEFFDDEALAAKQDEAIEAHRRGDTIEFEELGDYPLHELTVDARSS